ncbi:MAG: recombinase family protein [Clostridia bacterium]
MKRVYCLYRVSTLGQVDQNDIPMQRIDCRKFAEQQNWNIIKEFSEKGVSGFKVSSEDRDAIQQIKTDAILGKFDVLLVFMFDRLGRRDDETPFVVEWFVRNGIEVWSAKEGEQRFDSHMDKLTNYIRYWQASGESIKTSMRTKARLRQIVEEGHYKGGTAPYGYDLVKRGRFNKKSHELYELEVNDFEAVIVQVIFHKYVNEGLGIQRVATYLNENGIKTRSGDNWYPSSIRGMINNTTYTGILRSGEARSNVISELKIIEQETFDTVQDIARQRSNDYQQNRKVSLNTRGQALLSGKVYCGHCGSKLTLTTNGRGYINKDGEVTSRKRIRYVCYNKTRKRCDCDGQTGYTMSILDKMVENVIHQVFDRLKSIPENEIVGKRYKEKVKDAQVSLNKAKTDFAKATKELADYKAEVVKDIRGESSFTADLLNSLIAAAQEKCNEAEKIIDTLQNELEDSQQMLTDVKNQYNKQITWSEMFDNADIETKKMVVSNLINKVSVRRDYKIDIEQFSISA